MAKSSSYTVRADVLIQKHQKILYNIHFRKVSQSQGKLGNFLKIFPISYEAKKKKRFIIPFISHNTFLQHFITPDAFTNII